MGFLPVFLLLLFSGLPKNAYLKEEKINIDLQNVDLMEFIKTVSRVTKRNFMIEADVRGTITILGPSPIPISELWRIFLSILDARGYTVVKTGSIYRIVVSQSARTYPTPIVYGREPAYFTDQMITQIVPVYFVNPNDLANFVKNFTGTKGSIFAHPQAGTIIITDTGYNIERALELIRFIDSSGGSQSIAWIPLKYINASDAIQIIQSVFGGGKDQPLRIFPFEKFGEEKKKGSRTPPPEETLGTIRLLPDDRLNRIVAVGSPRQIAYLKEFLKEVDLPQEEGKNVHVYYLRYSNAQEVAQLLNELMGAVSPPGQPSAPKPQGGKIVANKALNALIFVASRTDFQEALNLLKKIDVPRPQVYIEAAILEVFLNNSLDTSIGGGVARSQTIRNEEGIVFGGEALGISPLGIDPKALATLNGLFAGAIVTPTTGNIPPIGIILRFVQGNTNVNVLSTPHILVLDNEEAEIIVGDNVPFLTGQTATQGGNVITTIERRDVGLTLRVTPQILASNLVGLKIYQEISNVSQQAPQGFNINQQGLITTKRSARTNVVVPDNQTIAIGGLISDQENLSESKVPILGDLPILGWFFKSHSTARTRTNLVIFLTPKIVRNEVHLAEATLNLSQRFQKGATNFLTPPQKEFFQNLPTSPTPLTTPSALEEYFEKEVVKPTPEPASEPTFSTKQPTETPSREEPEKEETPSPSKGEEDLSVKPPTSPNYPSPQTLFTPEVTSPPEEENP